MIDAGLLFAGLVAYIGAALVAGMSVYSILGERLWSLVLMPGVCLLALLPLLLAWDRPIDKWLGSLALPANQIRGGSALARAAAFLRRPYFGAGAVVALVLAVLAVIGFVPTLTLAFVAGALWSAYRGWKVVGRAPAFPAFFGTFLAANLVWLVGYCLEMSGADFIAPFRTAVFIESAKDLKIVVDPPAEDKSIRMRVSFTMPRALADYPEKEWAGIASHSTTIPYTVPVIFMPTLEFGFNEEHQGVSGRRDLGGSLRFDRYLIDGQPVKSFNEYGSSGYLWHRKGRYEMEFQWLPDRRGTRMPVEFAQGPCYSPVSMQEEIKEARSLAVDRRFVEPVRIKLVTTSFSPLRRLLWHRERLSHAGKEIRHELAGQDAPFSAYNLARLRLDRYAQAVQVSRFECDSKARLETCLDAGESCATPDASALIVQGRRELDAARTALVTGAGR